MVSIISDPIDAPLRPESIVKPDVVFLIDESGSMSPHRSAVVSTFNEYVAQVKGTAKTISLYTFDSMGIRERIFKVDPNRVKRLSDDDYRPNASTPLYDAMGKVITKFQYQNRPVQFFTHTDGMENASTEWTKASLDELIATMQDQHKWLFVHLMEGLEGRAAMKDFAGLKMGFSPHNRSSVMGMSVNSTALYSATMDSNPVSYTSSGKDTIDVDEGEEIKTREGTAR